MLSGYLSLRERFVDEVGTVVIGRNEEQTLRESLDSIREESPHVVYVDSASEDNSVGVARRAGVSVVSLDRSEPLSAARGRNAGWKYLKSKSPELRWVQFVDGDTVLEPGWLNTAAEYLRENNDVGVVAGRLRERFADRNIYHRLADMEFDAPTGVVEAVGGIATYRNAVLDQVGGFNPRIAAGEEWEVCSRIRRRGFKVVRLPQAMARHDIRMNEFSRWWKRACRSGQTYAEHAIDRRVMQRNVLSILFWGGAVPATAASLAVPTFGLSASLLLAYPVQWYRIRKDRIQRGSAASDASLYAAATLIGKVAECQGVLRVGWQRLRGARALGPSGAGAPPSAGESENAPGQALLQELEGIAATQGSRDRRSAAQQQDLA